jgi:WD40 repeat protein
MVHVLKGHKWSVETVVFSPDSKLLASSNGGEVRLWDVTTGKCLSVLYEGLNGVGRNCGSLAFSPDGKLLAGGIEGRWIMLWDTTKRVKAGVIETSEYFGLGLSSCVAFRPDGKTLVSKSNDRDGNLVISFTDVVTLKNVGATNVNIKAYVWAFSPDCRLFAEVREGKGWMDAAIEIYETATGKSLITLKGSEKAMAVSFSPDGKRLATAINETVKLWDVATGKHISSFTLTKPTSTYPRVEGYFRNMIYCVAFGPDGNTIAFGNSGEPVVELWNVETKKKITELKGKPLSKGDGIDSVAISPDGKMLAAGRFAGSGAWDETIELWWSRNWDAASFLGK